MSRPLLPPEQIDPAIRERVARLHADVLSTAVDAINRHEWVVLGMAGNPFVKKARKLLSAKGFSHEYLEFGGYLSQWRRRTALKMWTGWPTFPMVFHRGVLIGGAQDLERWLG
jgi:monothiol glutaredoxin